MYVNRAFYIGDEIPEGDSTAVTNHRTVPTPTDQLQANHRKNAGWAATQCGLANSTRLVLLGQGALLLLGWLLLFLVLGTEALPGGGLFALLALVLVGQLVGEATQVVGMPPLIGMLLTGVVARSTNLYQASGVYVDIVSVLREISLAIILLKAGLGLDPQALRRMSFTVLRLAVCPGLMEAVTVAVTTHYILGYPWLWGFALGFLLCAISPAVVVPTLLKLKKEGYGEGKGISTLVIAASSIDDVLAISVFSICISVIFSTGQSVVSQMLQGPLDVIVGLVAGAVWGLLCGFLPHVDDDHVVTKRVLMVGGAGVCAVLGSPTVGYPGAGPLACITAAFMAAVLWSYQGWDPASNPVEEVYSSVWMVFQPVLFALIGAEIDLKLLKMEIVTWGVIIILAALVIRVVTCSLVLVGGKLNFKEVVFVNLAWLPKATVQAALASQALDTARKAAVPDVTDLGRGSEVLTIAVLSILITAPLGAVGASFAGPRLLAKAHPSPAPTPSISVTSDIGASDQHNL